MRTWPLSLSAFANPLPLARRLLLGTLVAATVASVIFLSACGGDESALPPADSTAPAGSAPAAATPDTNAAVQSTQSPTTAPAAAPAQTTNTQAPAASPPSDPVSVVVGNVLLADLASNVGGDLVTVHSLVPAGGDAHTWSSTPQDSVRIAEAQVIVSNGAGLSVQVEELIENAASSNAVQVVASEGLDPQELVELPFPEGDHDDDHEGEEESVELRGRLLIGDGESGALSVIDLESGAVHQDEIDMGSRAGRIYATKSGRYAIAVSSDANAVHVLDGGIYLEEHGDHDDLIETDLSRLDLDLSGDRPVHLYVGGEWATVFYDGSGDVAFINEHELEEAGASYTPVVLNAGPHHGAAVPMDDDLFAITPQHPDYDNDPDEYRLPVGAEIWDLEGNTLHSASGCPNLHGDAGNGHMAVFGCTGGALVLEAHDGDYDDMFVPAPAGSPDDFRLTSVWGYQGLDHFFALGSAVGLYLVDPEAGDMEQIIPSSEDLRPVQVALSYDGELLLVVMSDGEIRMYDAHDLDLLASAADVLSEDIDPSFWSRPHVATAPGHVFVTDSKAGEVIALDSHDLEEVGHWEVAGTPTKIAFVGILDADDHPEEGHDDHGHAEGDPHFWMNPRMAVHYVNQIANGLIAADPGNAERYLDNAAAYIAELEDLDSYIQDALVAIPADHRVIVTFHDAFGYFGTRYDMEVMAFVGGHGGEASPDDIVQVLDLVQDNGLPAVMAEPQFATGVVSQIARDNNIQVGEIRSLPDAGQPDYIGMMRANADNLAELLR